MRATFNNMKIVSALKNPEVQELSDIKWLKALLGLGINSETERDGLKTSPMTANVRAVFQRNNSGMKFKVYQGVEIVNFCYSGIRGVSTHNSDVIENITCNFTDMKQLRAAIAEIVV